MCKHGRRKFNTKYVDANMVSDRQSDVWTDMHTIHTERHEQFTELVRN
jgi:hypothetical protein